MVRGDGGERRTKDVRIRATPEEHARYTAAASAAGFAELGRWAREVLNRVVDGGMPAGGKGQPQLRRSVRAPLPPLHAELVRQWTGIGTNLNQLARVANAEGRLTEPAFLYRLAAEIEARLNEMRGTTPAEPIVPEFLEEQPQVPEQSRGGLRSWLGRGRS